MRAQTAGGWRRWLMPVGLLMFLLAGSSSLHATAQIPETLIYEGKELPLMSTPLEDYFNDERKRPEFYPYSTACWRGYVGTWKIENGKLYLMKLEYDTLNPAIEKLRDSAEKDPPKFDSAGRMVDTNGKPVERFIRNKISFEEVFPKGTKAPVEASWFSGVLRIPVGERSRYVHMGFGSIYEKERYLTIKDGKVVAEREIDNTGKGATRSTPDLQWVALAPEPVEDKGNWTDARLLTVSPHNNNVLAGKSITTRGIIFIDGKGVNPAELWVPDTPKTKQVRLPMAQIQVNKLPNVGSHVEVTFHLDKKKHEYVVTEIRELKPGESMHHPDFKLEDLEAEYSE